MSQVIQQQLLYRWTQWQLQVHPRMEWQMLAADAFLQLQEQ
jgi:hypothetical protein